MSPAGEDDPIRLIRGWASRRISSPVWLLTAVGLGFLPAYVGTLAWRGTGDPAIIIGWGERVAHFGLARGLVGNYMPIDLEVFGFAASLGQATGLPPLVALKLVNLGFTVATFVLLILLLRAWRLNILWSLVYWAHPFFIAEFVLGYTDSHLSAFVMAGFLALAKAPAKWKYFVAGICFGGAAFVKAEAWVVVAILPLFLIVRGLQSRDMRAGILQAVQLSAGTAILFVAYSAFFALSGLGPWALLTHVRHASSTALQALSAQAPNFWFLVAELFREPGQLIYEVRGPALLHDLAFVITAAAMCLWVLLAARLPDGRRGPGGPYAAATLATLTVPMTLTLAHENHFYLGGALLVAYLAAERSVVLRIAVFGFLTLLLLNLSGFYGLGPDAPKALSAVGAFKVAYVSNHLLEDAVAALCVVAWIFIVGRLSRDGRAPSPPRVAGPIAGGNCQ